MNSSLWRNRYRLAVIPAPAVLLGAWVMHRHGVAAEIWWQNVAVWFVGSILLIACGTIALQSAQAWRHSAPFLALIALGVVAASLGFAGLQGVHRWLVIGGVRLHASAMVLPLFISILGCKDSRIAWPLALGMGMLLWLQPDASQATGFFLAAIPVFLNRQKREMTDWLGISALVGLTVATWTRVDPLGSVPHVEGIVVLANGLSPLLGVVAAASLVAPVCFFLYLARFGESHERAVVFALGSYLAGVLLATWSGRFPVPFMGYGVSPIIGYFIALAWIVRMPSRSA